LDLVAPISPPTNGGYCCISFGHGRGLQPAQPAHPACDERARGGGNHFRHRARSCGHRCDHRKPDIGTIDEPIPATHGDDERLGDHRTECHRGWCRDESVATHHRVDSERRRRPQLHPTPHSERLPRSRCGRLAHDYSHIVCSWRATWRDRRYHDLRSMGFRGGWFSPPGRKFAAVAFVPRGTRLMGSTVG
jgi:hypothetical protein